MAAFKPFLIPMLFLSLALLHLAVLTEATANEFDQPHHQLGTNIIGTHRSLLAPFKIDCGAACGARCRLSSRPRLCKRACRTCCGRCNCVPPGTSGNYDSCACYASLTTHGGRRKCP